MKILSRNKIKYRITQLCNEWSLGALLLFPIVSWATPQCSGTEDYTRVYANITSPLTIKPELNIGDVISTTTTSFPPGTTTIKCNISGPGYFIGNGVGIPNGELYPTSIPGVSYRIKFITGWLLTGFSNVYWPVKAYSNSSTLASGNYDGGTIVIDLVKTGPTPGNTTWAPATLGYINLNSGVGTFNFIEIYNSTPVATIPENPSCTITQSAIPVNLDDVNTAQLANSGNTSKDTAFTIPLKCTSAANISLGFSGNMADSNNAVFSNLSGEVNANHVGIQILSDAVPVPTASGSYLNLGVINGSISVPLVARYYALASNPEAGAVSAIAYATIIYN